MTLEMKEYSTPLLLLGAGLYFIFMYFTNYSTLAKKLEIQLIDNDVYIITNDFCKCKHIRFGNFFKFTIKCNLCHINRVIDFEKEKNIYYLLENLNERSKFIIHTEGGDTDLANFLPYIISQNNIELISFIPQYALSAGSFIALASRKIYLNWYSSMGPIDTQIDYSNSNSDDEDDFDESFPAKHIKEITSKKNSVTKLRSMEANSYHVDDLFLIKSIFKKKKKRDQIIRNFLNTNKSHSIRYGPKDLKRFGLNVEVGIPEDIKEIFNLFKRVK
jgi:hypothetical protein